MFTKLQIMCHRPTSVQSDLTKGHIAASCYPRFGESTRPPRALERQRIYRWCTVVSATLKYDELEVENVALGRSPSATFSTSGHHIWMSHERPCFICFVVWPTTSLKNNFWLIFNFYQQRSCARSTPFARWRWNIRCLHSNKLKCKFVLQFGNVSCLSHIVTLTQWPFWLQVGLPL